MPGLCPLSHCCGVARSCCMPRPKFRAASVLPCLALPQEDVLHLTLKTVAPSCRRGGFERQTLQRSSAPADDYRPQWSAFERGGLEHHSAPPAHFGGDSGGGPFAPSPEERIHQVRLAVSRPVARFLSCCF